MSERQMRPLNVLFMAHLAPPSHCAGAEMMALSMLRPLVKRGHKVDWLLSRQTADTEPYDLHGITVHPTRGKGHAPRMLAEADIVVSHLENMPRAVILSRAAGVPFVLIMHNDHEISRSWAVADASALVVNSRWMYEAFGHPRNGVIVRPPVFAKDYRTRPGSKVTLVNLCENKGGAQFVMLAERMPDVEFLAVKGAYGTQIVPDLPNVEVREHGTDMREAYSSTRLLVMPSLYESWGRVGVEAMCSGIPVIAHPTRGLREALGAAGTYVDRRDLNGWESAVRRLLAPSAWRTASKAALARAGELDPTPDIERWVDLIERSATRGRRAA